MTKNGQTRCNSGTASLTSRLLFAHTIYGYKHKTNNYAMYIHTSQQRKPPRFWNWLITAICHLIHGYLHAWGFCHKMKRSSTYGLKILGSDFEKYWEETL